MSDVVRYYVLNPDGYIVARATLLSDAAHSYQLAPGNTLHEGDPPPGTPIYTPPTATPINIVPLTEDGFPPLQEQLLWLWRSIHNSHNGKIDHTSEFYTKMAAYSHLIVAPHQSGPPPNIPKTMTGIQP